jgi:hypothetical protein
MSALNFCTMPSNWDCGVDLSDDTFVWASRNVSGWDVVEDFVYCGVWLLAADVSFEHVKADLTPVSKLNVPLPRFPLCREDDAHFLARVEQEARNIGGSYTCTKNEACIASLPNNGHLNHVLKIVGVVYVPRPVPVSLEVLKKRKVDASVKALAKCLKVPEKKGAEPTTVFRALSYPVLRNRERSLHTCAHDVQITRMATI